MEEEEQNPTADEPSSPPLADAGNPSSPIVVVEPAPVQDSITPAEGISKRQRRPNVRLNEIGTNVLECLLKHKGGPSSNRAPSPLAKLYPKTESRIPSSGPSTGRLFEKNIVSVNGGSSKGKVAHSNRHGDEIRRTKPKTFSGYEGSSWRYMHNREPEEGAEHLTHDVENWMEVQAQMEKDDILIDMKDDNNAGSSFRNDLTEGYFPKQKKKKSQKMSTYSMKVGHPSACEEKEEPSSSGVQELRQQVPLWERGIAPLDEKVREWLCNLGLSKYSFLFQRHEVGDDVLPLLTMDDLREIGIAAVGARRKIFSEITKLRKEKGLISEDAYAFG